MKKYTESQLEENYKSFLKFITDFGPLAIFFFYFRNKIFNGHFDPSCYQVQAALSEHELFDLWEECEMDIAKWNEKTISDDEMIRIGEKHLETFNGLLDKYDELQPPDAFIKSVKLLRLSLEYQIESHEHRLGWIKNGDESELIRSQELTQ